MDTITVSRPNFLGSEVGLVLKTVSVDAVTNAAIAVTEVGVDGFQHKTIKAGSMFVSGNIKGLIYQDIDVTDTTATTKVPAPLMVAGYFINDATRLPAVLTDATTLKLSDAAAQGLFPMATEIANPTRPY